MGNNKATFHIIWGVLLVFMGIALIFRTPFVMERIVQIEYYAEIKWLVRIILYIIAVMLIAGGSRKIYDNHRNISASDGN
jgi:threonine/homoserine/homoserine lactone efflux protein